MPQAPILVPDIVVIGASAGGVVALREIVQALPATFPAAVFVVLHLRRDSPSMLAALLGQVTALRVGTAVDGDPIEPGTVYVAPPDRHMTLEPQRVRVSFGPVQNRVRPSIDVLFRSAALTFGPRVIGVVLTGYLSDGTAGLLTIKEHGGITIVQDPKSALHRGMPDSALRSVPVDHCVSLPEVASLLTRLVSPARESSDRLEGDTMTRTDAKASNVHAYEASADLGRSGLIEDFATPSSFLCPDCGGALWEIREGQVPRYRCRVGHGYAVENLVASQDSSVERALWAATRSLEDRAALGRQLAQQWSDRDAPEVLHHFRRQAELSAAHAATIRGMLEADAVKDSK